MARRARRRRWLGGLLVLLALGACAEPVPRRNPVMTGAARIADDAGTVEAQVFDVPPGADLLAILLIAPDGSETPSGPFAVVHGERGPGYGPTGIGVSLTGGSNSGLSAGISAGVNSSGGGPSEASTWLTAEIAVPDPAKLLADRRAWRVELRWVEVGGTARTLLLPWR